VECGCQTSGEFNSYRSRGAFSLSRRKDAEHFDAV
jgi:hypothetical protein